MFGLFKSKITRRNEAWIHFHADLIRESLQWVWVIERKMNDTADFQKLQDRLFSESFAGYLAGFAEVLVSELAQDSPTRAKYARMFFDCVMTKRGGDWVEANIVNYATADRQSNQLSQPPDFDVGFGAGRDDARDFTTSKEAKALTRLGKFFIKERGLAA